MTPRNQLPACSLLRCVFVTSPIGFTCVISAGIHCTGKSARDRRNTSLSTHFVKLTVKAQLYKMQLMRNGKLRFVDMKNRNNILRQSKISYWKSRIFSEKHQSKHKKSVRIHEFDGADDTQTCTNSFKWTFHSITLCRKRISLQTTATMHQNTSILL